MPIWEKSPSFKLVSFWSSEQFTGLEVEPPPRMNRVNIHGKFETPGTFGCPKGAEEMNFSPKRLTTLKNFEIFFFEKLLSVSFLPRFV